MYVINVNGLRSSLTRLPTHLHHTRYYLDDLIYHSLLTRLLHHCSHDPIGQMNLVEVDFSCMAEEPIKNESN